MPDYTVSGDVDSMLRSANDAAIRSAIGVGTTDAPTFAGVTSTGVLSLPVGSTTSTAIRFGTQGATTGLFSSNGATSPGIGLAISGTAYIYSGDSSRGLCLHSGWPLSWGSNQADSTPSLFLYRDGADGILAQRNVGTAQTFRVYNSTDATPATNFDRASFGFPTGTNTLRIGTENSGTTGYTTARPIDFVTGGVARWQISAAGHLLSAGVTDGLYDIGASGANRPRNIFIANTLSVGGNFNCTNMFSNGPLVPIRLLDGSGNDFSRLQLGGTADTHPAIARDGAGIKITGAAAGSTSWIKVPAVAVASLPLAATAGVGARSFVNDALTPVFGSAVTGGGAVTVPVYSTGSAWNVG